MSAIVPRSGRFSAPLRASLLYGVMLAVAVGLFLFIRARGEMLPPGTAAVPARPAWQADALPHVLLALAAVVLTGQVLGRVCVYMGQPPVIGEVMAGILLGPSLLGRVWPEAMHFLLPTESVPFLNMLAQLGVILYLFLVGLELNAGLLGHRAQSAVAISHASILAPFVLGAVLALGVYHDLAPVGVSFTSFALFMGVALSVTAFPVLARILTDRGMEKTELGVLALGCAAADDVTAWCLLAFVVGVARARLDGVLVMLVLSLAFVAFMLGVVRPVAARLARHWGERVPRGAAAVVFVAVLLSALATEAIGIHALFGAFLLGAVIPHESGLARAFKHKLEDVVTVLLLPAFFAFSGLRTSIGLVSGWGWLTCAVIVLAATLGKFGGTLAAARWTGQSWRTATALGLLMNTRGLMELIVLGVGLEMGVISDTLYAMMVVMALVTTLATTPLLAFLRR
jgi:Kef-type K+ transport system membrane component KefB